MSKGPAASADRSPRWGEALLLVAVAPGVCSGAMVSLLLTLGYLQWPSTLGPFTNAFAWAAVSTPMLVTLGTLTLASGAVLALFLPGRAVWKWSILLVGTLAWGGAFYALTVPGLIDLP